jgi:D-serine deaminase-like pyridoxal phosphate-dependent protein
LTDGRSEGIRLVSGEGSNALPPKGFPDSAANGVGVGWSVFDADVPYPIAVMFDSAIEHNSKALQEYCRRRHVSFAPHGKTTMAPALFRRQLRDGAWAITAATTWQARTMRASGVGRVLIASQVVVPGEIEWMARAADEGFEVFCYVDSLAGVAILDETLDRARPQEPLPVLLEHGVRGGRTGVRSVAEGLLVAEAAASSPHLVLTGTAGFEGILGAAGERDAAAVVGEYLDQIVVLTHAVAARGLFAGAAEVIVTAGGSAYFDHVVDHLSTVHIDLPVRVVIRPGCYISHDDGALHEASPMGARPRTGHAEQLVPAIEVWGAVLSRPEPTRAIVGIGKRDASTDGLLPVLKKVRRRGAAVVEPVEETRVVQVNDQHSYLDLDPADPLAVGDLVGFGISHPCTTFDKWRAIPIVDDAYRVVEIAETHF